MNTKKTLLTLSILLSFALANAQKISVVTPKAKQPIKLKAIQFTTGASWDKYSNMSMDMIVNKTKNMPEYEDEIKGMKENLMYSSGGLHSGVNLSLRSPILNNEVLATEWRVGASVTLLKESLVEYSSTRRNTKKNSSMMYCFVENDVKLSSDILFRFGDESLLTFYTGGGVNVSSSFNNNLQVFQDYSVETGVINDFSEAGANNSQQTYDGKSIAYARAYIPIGLSLKWFRHLESNMEYKFGGGFEQVIGGNATGFKTGEFTIGLRYNIQKNSTPNIFDLF